MLEQCLLNLHGPGDYLSFAGTPKNGLNSTAALPGKLPFDVPRVEA